LIDLDQKPVFTGFFYLCITFIALAILKGYNNFSGRKWGKVVNYRFEPLLPQRSFLRRTELSS